MAGPARSWLNALTVLTAIVGAVASPGCADEPAQSALHPAGPAAASIAWLWWVMCWTFAAVFVLVIVLLLLALRGRNDPPGEPTALHGAEEQSLPPLGRNGFIVAGGLALPIVIVTPLYVLSLDMSASKDRPADALAVRVVGHMWWWEIRYPQSDIVTANEIHIPVGRPVRLELVSADVIHSFWVPALHGKRDMIPGLENEFWIQADKPGVYRGQCAEYCGLQHANMALHVVALPATEFDAWLESQSPVAQSPDEQPVETQSPALPAEPATPAAHRGLQVFMAAGCAQCHAIRDTPAIGNAGPDLTHIGSRGTLGAAMLPNNRGNLAGWVANPQAIKPGARMPRTYLAADDLFDLLDYLEGLR